MVSCMHLIFMASLDINGKEPTWMNRFQKWILFLNAMLMEQWWNHALRPSVFPGNDVSNTFLDFQRCIQIKRPAMKDYYVHFFFCVSSGLVNFMDRLVFNVKTLCLILQVTVDFLSIKTKTAISLWPWRSSVYDLVAYGNDYYQWNTPHLTISFKGWRRN